MIELGSVVNATITRVEPYGIYLSFQGETVFVPANNVEWVPTPTTLGTYHVGDSIDVIVERLNPENNIYAASIKHLHPEGNPYEDISRLPPQAELKGKVKIVHQHGVSVEVENACIGELPLTNDTRALQEGEHVTVQVTGLDVENQRMLLKLLDSQESA